MRHHPADFEVTESSCEGKDHGGDGATDEVCPCGALLQPCAPGGVCSTDAAAGTSSSACGVSTDGDEVWVPPGTSWIRCSPLDDRCKSTPDPGMDTPGT